LWTGIVIVGLSSAHTNAQADQSDLLSASLDENGKFVLTDLDVNALQALNDALNPDCLPGGIVSCSWTVLSLVHRPLDAADGVEPVTPVVPDAQKNPAENLPANKRFSNDVPPGFEQLAARESDTVSLYFEGESILNARVFIDGDSYRFADPVLVARKLAFRKIAPRSNLEYLLSEQFPVSDLTLCVVDAQPLNCETKQPFEFALLPKFDDSRIDILVGRLGNGQSGQGDRFFPSSSTPFSARAGVRATYASVEGIANTIDGQLVGSVSYGNGGLFLQDSFSNQADTQRIDSLYFGHQFAQHEFRLGIVRYESSEFLLSNELLGADWTTSFNRYKNIRELYSTPVFVTLNGTSVVQLLVNDTLLHSVSLPSGNHQIDTRNLPSGTYDLEIRIQDAASGLQTIRQTYSKQLSLPPPDKLLYSLSAGKPRITDANTLDTADDVLLSGSVAKRLSPSFGLDVTLTSFSSEQTVQARLSRIGTSAELSISALVGSESAFGQSLRAAYTVNSFRAVVQGTRFTSNHDIDNDESIAKLFRHDFFSRSINLGYAAGDFNYALSAEKVTQSSPTEDQNRHRYTARIRKKIPALSAGSAVSASYISSDAGDEVRVQLDVALNQPNTQHIASLHVDKHDDGPVRPALGYQVTHGPVDGFAPLSVTDTTVAFRTRLSEGSSFAGADLRLAHQYYDLGVGVDLFDDESADSYKYRTIASFGTQVAATPEKIAVGRNTGQSAGIIIDVEGQPAGSKFDIKVNGAQRAVGRVGSKFFLPLQPFQEHRIDLLPHSLVLGNFESSSRVVSLHPGNVAVLQIDVQGRYVLITRFTDSQGDIIADKVVRYQGQPYFINSDGVVQMEVIAGDTLDIDLGDDASCTVEVPDADGKEIVVNTAPLICL